MSNLAQLEASYQLYVQDLTEWVPDGVIDVDLVFLQRLDLLSELADREDYNERITHYFHVVESPEKITLFNSDFAVWIVPEVVNGRARTFALVALNNDEGPQLELVFSAAGVYNTSRMVLRVLERVLEEVAEAEEAVAWLKRSC